jgi:putative ABC transport system permease protein
VTLLSKDFLKLVTLSFILATPIALYAVQQWLHDFAYRIDLKWWVFPLAGIIAVVIALITISFQAIKAAIAQPC